MKRLIFLLFIITSSHLFADQAESVLDIKDTAVAVLNAEKLTATQQGLLQVVIENGATEHKLEKTIDPKIKQIVLDAIKEFNINVPIILFQHKDVGASIGYKDGHKYYAGHKYYKGTEILCLWIGNLFAHRENTDNTNEPLNLLKYDAYKAIVYHELGHYINGHNKSKRMLYATAFLLSGAIASQFLCISLYDKVSFSKAVVLQVLSAAMPLLLYKVYKSVIDPFMQRKREIEADSFAIKNLLVKNDFNAIIGKLLWYRSLFVWDAANSPKVFSTWRYIEIYSQRSHPTEMERAEFILQELKKAGINLKQIPFNLKESDRAIVQKEVDELIARFFPQYIQQSQNSVSKNYSHNGNSLGMDLINLKLKNGSRPIVNEYDIDRNIYVINVLKQDLDNTCGRHAIKNLIYFMQAIQQNDLEILTNLYDKEVFSLLNKELCEYLHITNKYQDITFPHKFFTLFSNFTLFINKHGGALPGLDNNLKDVIANICPMPSSLDKNNALMIKEFRSKIFSNQCDLFVSSIEKDQSKKSSTKEFYMNFFSSSDAQLDYDYCLPISFKKVIDDFKKSDQQLLGFIILLPSGQIGHWIGVVIRKIAQASFEIYILDSGHNRINYGLKNTLDFLMKEFSKKNNLQIRG